MDINLLIEFLQGAIENPWLLSFLGVWVVGYMLKEHSPLNNKLIPWVVILIGGTLGYVIIESSLAGVIVGAVMGVFQVGLYETVKNTLLAVK